MIEKQIASSPSLRSGFLTMTKEPGSSKMRGKGMKLIASPQKKGLVPLLTMVAGTSALTGTRPFIWHWTSSFFS